MTLFEIISRADELSSRGEYEAAIGYYHEWLASSNAEQHLRYAAFFNLGTLLQRTGQYDKAIVAYHECLKLKPDFSEASENFALAVEAKGRIPTGSKPVTLLEIMKKAQELSSQSQVDEAITCYREWLSSPTSEEHLHYVAFFNLGTLLHKQGKIDEAILSYRESLKLKPDFPEAKATLNMALAAKSASK